MSLPEIGTYLSQMKQFNNRGYVADAVQIHQSAARFVHLTRWQNTEGIVLELCHQLIVSDSGGRVRGWCSLDVFPFLNEGLAPGRYFHFGYARLRVLLQGVNITRMRFEGDLVHELTYLGVVQGIPFLPTDTGLDAK